MTSLDSRRHFLATLTATGAAAWIPRAARAVDQGDDDANTDAVETATLAAGDLKALLRDNSHSPQILSGLESLTNERDAPGFDAFDPDVPGASAGLNFEHIIAGHNNRHNAFAPRQGRYTLHVGADGRSVALVRRREDDPWAMSSKLIYRMAPPHAIDVDFRCTPHDAALFGARGYAILFFANYMHDVADVAPHFRGIDRPGGSEQWIAADAPPGHRDWNQGGTYRSAPANELAYDDDHNFKLNSWSYDYPRFTRPFYFGRAARGMTLALMFDRLHSTDDEVRFSLFKFKVPRRPRPAWDFQYVIRGVCSNREYGFRARLVWKKFVGPDECLHEYLAWSGQSK